MHSIERYGIVALLFLVVTVVAVLMWDGGKNKKKDGLSGATATAPVAPRERAGAEDRRAARRLALAAEPQPGPLARQPDRGASDPRANPLPPAVDPTTMGAPLDSGTAEARAPAAAPPTTQTPPEEPARETVVGRATQAPTHAYTVRSGDTLSEIAQRELGSARRWNEIVAANPGLDPTRLRAGKTIRIPGAGSSAPARVNPAPAKAATSATEEGRTWKVAKGENLWKIAERALGDGKRWKEIAALNPRANPDRLVLGQVLRLPAAAPVKNAPPKKPTGERSPMVASAAGGSARGGRVR
jgi:nucleoid-associated protein YgaU